MLVRPESNSRDLPKDNPMLIQLSHQCAVDQTLQRTSSWTNFQKNHETKRRRQWINFVLVKRGKWTFTPTSHLCSEHLRPEEFESQFSAIPGTSFVGRRSLKNDAFFFKIGTSERHTGTGLVNFVYYPTGFLWSNRLHQGFNFKS